MIVAIMSIIIHLIVITCGCTIVLANDKRVLAAEEIVRKHIGSVQNCDQKSAADYIDPIMFVREKNLLLGMLDSKKEPWQQLILNEAGIFEDSKEIRDMNPKELFVKSRTYFNNIILKCESIKVKPTINIINSRMDSDGYAYVLTEISGDSVINKLESAISHTIRLRKVNGEWKIIGGSNAGFNRDAHTARAR